MTRETTCAFTGHRPNRLPWGRDESDPRCITLKGQIAQAIQEAYDQGVRTFLCGMAMGADFYFCEAALTLQKEYPDLFVVAVIPCDTQSQRWNKGDKERYGALLARCDHQIFVQHEYTPNCALRRNRYMVNASSRLIAAFDGVMEGGTLYTITYAMKHGLDLHIIDLPTT